MNTSAGEKEKVDRIIAEEIISQLDSIARNCDKYCYGLPQLVNSDEYREMVRTIVDIIHNRDEQSARAVRSESETDWKPINSEGDLPKDGENYLWQINERLFVYGGQPYFAGKLDTETKIVYASFGNYGIRAAYFVAYRPLPEPFRALQEISEVESLPNNKREIF